MRNRKLWIVGICILGVFLAIGIPYWIIYQNSPQYILTTYCNAVKSRNYQNAYQQLSNKTTSKSDLSEQQLTTNIEADANPRGGIGDCKISYIKEKGTLAYGTIIFIYGNGSSSPHQYALFKSDSNPDWKIDTSYPVREF